MSREHLPAGLAERHYALRRESLAEFERIACRENSWLTYTLLGWTNLVACGVSHYLVQVLQIQDYWPYVLLWVVQIGAAVASTMVAGSGFKTDDLPLLADVNRIGTVFVLLCWNVAMLNVLLGLPIFVLAPVLATLSSFALLTMSMILSRWLIAAALVMVVTGSLMALFPQVSFLIYGAGWLLVLQTLGFVFFRKQRRWQRQAAPADTIRLLPAILHQD